MPIFNWVGKTNTGEEQSGQIEAENNEMAIALLKQQNIKPTKVKKKPLEININLPSINMGINIKVIVVFTRQFATMIEAGLPIVQCLDIMASQSDSKPFQKILYQVKYDVEGGNSFADALGKHPKAFDDLYVNLIAAGEVGGILDTILKRLAIYIEKNVKLKRQIKGALTYPTTIGIVAFGVIFIMLYKVIPTFQQMFMDFGNAAMPALTQAVINMSDFVQKNVLLILGGVAGVVFLFMTFTRHKRTKPLWHRFLLKMPLVGPLLRKVAVARFTRTMSTMLTSGVPILDALQIVSRTAGNIVIERGILYTREKIIEGRTMADPLKETGVFPPMVVQMIAVGETTGALDQMLDKIADFYEDEVDVAVGALTSMIEPIMMVFLGGIVGTLLISMYLPIFKMAGNIKSH